MLRPQPTRWFEIIAARSDAFLTLESLAAAGCVEVEWHETDRLPGASGAPAELLKQFPDAKTGDGLHYNPYFKNLNLAMAAPLTGEGQVTYSDGTKATVDQMSTDVTAFLVWTGEPNLAHRRQTGFWWIGFMIFATVLGYMSYRNIWAEKKGH